MEVVWLLIGADSGFEARTEIYFTRVSVSFAPIGSGERGSCAERYVTARAIRSREEIPAFVRCAAEYALEHGETEARRAFQRGCALEARADLRLRARAGAAGEGLGDACLPAGAVAGGGRCRERRSTGSGQATRSNCTGCCLWWTRDGFTTRSPTRRREGAAKEFVREEIDWNGARAAIGATHYSPDLPGTCRAEEVNALALEEGAERGEAAGVRPLRCAGGGVAGVFRGARADG